MADMTERRWILSLDKHSLRVRRRGCRHEVELEVRRGGRRGAGGREFLSLGMK
jgi:hypothetical protein